MIYIKKVESTLKKGVYAKLSPRTVIYGPNGAGKSSVIQAMELATCGHVSDVEGREQVKHAHAIGRLFPPDEAIFVEVELSDDTKFRWSMERNSEDGFKRPEHDCPRTVSWPVQELKSTLTGDATSVQAWLEQQVIGSITEEDLLRSLPYSTHEHVKQLVKKVRKHDFIALAKEAKSKARQSRTDATKLENTVEQMMQNVPAPLMADERQRLDKRLIELDQNANVGVTAGQKSLWEEELASVAAQYNSTQTSLNGLKLPTDNDFKVAKTVGTALELVKTHAKELGLDACWTCGNPTPNFVPHVERLTQTQEKLKPFADALASQKKLETELETLHAKLKRLEESVATAQVAPDNKAERDGIYRQIAADDAARQSWTNANMQRADVDRMRIQADQLTLAAKALEKAGKDLLERRKSDFEAKVNQFLPPGDQFVVDLDSARIGLLRNGHIHSALSGAEWSRVLLALASTVTKPGSLCVLAPEDRAWDKKTLEKVMTALAQSEVQIVLMSTILPDAVEGWSVVAVDL